MLKTAFAKTMIVLMFIPIALARAVYEGVLGFYDGLMIESKDFVRLMKNPVRKW